MLQFILKKTKQMKWKREQQKGVVATVTWWHFTFQQTKAFKFVRYTYRVNISTISYQINITCLWADIQVGVLNIYNKKKRKPMET